MNMEGIGQRERNKVRTWERLRDAAESVFLKWGYASATTKEVAQVAGLAQSTLFRYVPDKAELLFLVMNKALDEAHNKGVEAALTIKAASPSARLAALYRPRYELLARWPDMGRHFVRESSITLLDGDALSPETLRSAERMQTQRKAVSKILYLCINENKLSADIPLEECARMISSLYLMELRHFLNETVPDEAEGMLILQRLFTLSLKGYEI